MNGLPLSKNTYHIKFNLQNSLQILDELRTVKNKIPPCFDGLQQSI